MSDKRLIDANALDLVPDIHNAMNGVIFVNNQRSGGRTQMIVQQLLTRMISNAPTIDAVPVVRCRDCIYASTTKFSSKRVACAYWAQMVSADGYCSNGVTEGKYNGNG